MGALRAARRSAAGLPSARPAVAEGRRTAPAACPAVEDVRALDVGLDQARRPVGHDIIGVIMGRVADRRIDCPDSAASATLRARFHSAGIGAWAIEPSQVKVNWQPVARVEPSKTTPQTLLGKAGWRTRFRTTCATARWPSVAFLRGLIINGAGQAFERAGAAFRARLCRTRTAAQRDWATGDRDPGIDLKRSFRRQIADLVGSGFGGREPLECFRLRRELRQQVGVAPLDAGKHDKPDRHRASPQQASRADACARASRAGRSVRAAYGRR